MTGTGKREQMSVGQQRLTELTRGESLRLLGSVPLGRIVFTLHAMPAIRLVNHLLDGEDHRDPHSLGSGGGLRGRGRAGCGGGL